MTIQLVDICYSNTQYFRDLSVVQKIKPLPKNILQTAAYADSSDDVKSSGATLYSAFEKDVIPEGESVGLIKSVAEEEDDGLEQVMIAFPKRKRKLAILNLTEEKADFILQYCEENDGLIIESDSEMSETKQISEVCSQQELNVMLPGAKDPKMDTEEENVQTADPVESTVVGHKTEGNITEEATAAGGEIIGEVSAAESVKHSISETSSDDPKMAVKKQYRAPRIMQR